MTLNTIKNAVITFEESSSPLSERKEAHLPLVECFIIFFSSNYFEEQLSPFFWYCVMKLCMAGKCIQTFFYCWFSLCVLKADIFTLVPWQISPLYLVEVLNLHTMFPEPSSVEMTPLFLPIQARVICGRDAYEFFLFFFKERLAWGLWFLSLSPLSLSLSLSPILYKSNSRQTCFSKR